MILYKGTLLPDSQLSAVLDGLEAHIISLRTAPPLRAEVTISALEGLLERLDGGELDEMIAQYAPPGTLDALAELRPMLSRSALEGRLTLELGPGWAGEQKRPFGVGKYLPLGTLLHVAAGNMPGLPAFTAVEGLLTGNINLIKLPREDKGLSLAILQQLTQQEPQLAPYLCAFDLPSSDKRSLQKLSDLADGIVVWGGDEAVRAMRAMAPTGCKLMEWGHRLSFSYLSHYQGLEGELDGLARHIVQTGGLLCSSCQIIYLDTDDLIAGEVFCKNFLPRLEKAARSAHNTIGTAAQGALYAYEAELEQIVDRKNSGDRIFRGRGCSVTFRKDDSLELSHLNGNVLVKCLPHDRLAAALFPQRGRLQTAGLICPEENRKELATLLLQAGVNRVTRGGSMSHTFPGEAHDGEYPLRRYVRMTDTET